MITVGLRDGRVVVRAEMGTEGTEFTIDAASARALGTGLIRAAARLETDEEEGG
jgi:hypothetical protein